MDDIKIWVVVGILALCVLAALTTRLPTVKTPEPPVVETGPVVTPEPEPEPVPVPEADVPSEPVPEPLPEPQTPPAT